MKDVPRATDEEIQALADAVAEFRAGDAAIRFHRTKAVFGVLTLSGGRLDPRITDSSTMERGRLISEIHPLCSAAWVPAAATHGQGGQGLPAACLPHPVPPIRSTFHGPPGESRRSTAWSPSAPDRLATLPSLHDRYGLWGLSISSGAMYAGLAELLEMNHIPAPSGQGPETDYHKALDLAFEQLDDHDFIHVHTKEPDQAAHTKDPGPAKWRSSRPWTGPWAGTWTGSPPPRTCWWR